MSEREELEPGSKEELLSQIACSVASLGRCLSRMHPPDLYSGDAQEMQRKAIANLLESQSLLLESFKVVALADWKNRRILK